MLTIKKSFWSRSRKTLSALVMASALVAGAALSIPAIVSVHAEDTPEVSTTTDSTKSTLRWSGLEHAKVTTYSIVFEVDGAKKYFYPASPNVDLTKYVQSSTEFVVAPTGATVTLDIVPDEGYKISDLGNLTAVNGKENRYTITLETSGEISVTAAVTAVETPTPEEPTTDPEETPKTVKITPDSASSNDKAATVAVIEAVREVVNGATSATGISEELAQKITDNVGKDFSISLSVAPVTSVDSTEASLIAAKKAASAEVLGYFDIDLVLKADNVALGNITELETPITVSLDLSSYISGLEALPEGSERIFEVVRIHDGVAELISGSLDANGIFTFSTNKFSTYTVTYRTVATVATNTNTNTGSTTNSGTATVASSSTMSSSDSDSSASSTSASASSSAAISNPSTSDSAASYFVVGLISLAGLVGTALYLIRRPVSAKVLTK